MFASALPAVEQQQHADHKEKIDSEECQQDLNNNRCTGIGRWQAPPSQQAHPDDTTTHAGDRQQSINRFTDRRRPKQVPQPGVARVLGPAQQNPPAERIREKIEGPVRK